MSVVSTQNNGSARFKKRVVWILLAAFVFLIAAFAFWNGKDPSSERATAASASGRPALDARGSESAKMLSPSPAVAQSSTRLGENTRREATPAGVPAPPPKPPVRGDAVTEDLIAVEPQQPIARRAPPLSTPAPRQAPVADGKSRGVGRELRVAELLKEAAEDPDPRQAQNALLTVGAYQVGDGDWDAARETYEKLRGSPYPEVIYSVARNLDVVNRNQAILKEQDATQREWLQLDLATVHQNYGHEKAAKRLLRSLADAATHEPVRQQAAQRLATYVAPPLSSFQIQPPSSQP